MTLARFEIFEDGRQVRGVRNSQGLHQSGCAGRLPRFFKLSVIDDQADREDNEAERTDAAQSRSRGSALRQLDGPFPNSGRARRDGLTALKPVEVVRER